MLHTDDRPQPATYRSSGCLFGRRVDLTGRLGRQRHTAKGRLSGTLSFLPLYGMFLLAQFRDRRAYPLIADVCKLPRETLDGLPGDAP